MKKLGAVLVIVWLAVTLTACSTFNDYQEHHLPENTPQTTSVLVQFDATAGLAPTAIAEKLAELDAALNRVIEAGTDGTPRLTAYQWETAADNPDYTMTLTLTLADVPDQVITVDTKPFYHVRTQTVFNPISLLPETADFTYYLAFTATRRHSRVSTDLTQAQNDGTYLYVWADGRDIIFTDYYANPPLYYLITIAVTVVVGVAVYFISRYFYCKKTRNPL